MSAAPDDLFAVTLVDGTVIERRADDIRSAIEAGYTDDGTCLVCGTVIEGGGRGPHMASHRRLIGEQPATTAKKKPKKRAPRTKKPQPPKPDPVEMPPLAETLAGVLYGYVGKTIPVSMLAEVNEWMRFTEALIDALNRPEEP